MKINQQKIYKYDRSSILIAVEGSKDNVRAGLVFIMKHNYCYKPNYWIALILETMTAIKIPKTPMKAKRTSNSIIQQHIQLQAPSENQENLHLIQSLKLRQVEHFGFSPNAIVLEQSWKHLNQQTWKG
jgi:hypothetical protein